VQNIIVKVNEAYNGVSRIKRRLKCLKILCIESLTNPVKANPAIYEDINQGFSKFSTPEKNHAKKGFNYKDIR
jgi:hypothetical protein